MGYGDMIFLGIVVALVGSFWFRTRWRFQDDQRDDASHDRARARDLDNDSSGGDGGGD